MVMDFYQKNPSALASLRGTVYEEKIIDLIKTKAKPNKKTITKEEAEKVLKEHQKQEHNHNHPEEEKVAAKKDAADILSQANLRANQVIEDAKEKAQEEADRIKVSAEKDVVQSMNKAREGLRSEVAVLAVAGAEKLLKAEINKESNAALIDEIAGEL
jgi:ATP synthase F0 subunit b